MINILTVKNNFPSQTGYRRFLMANGSQFRFSKEPPIGYGLYATLEEGGVVQHYQLKDGQKLYVK